MRDIRTLKDLEDIVNETIEKNPKALLEIQSGIRSSIDELVNEVLKKCSTKVDPKHVRRLILSKL